MTEITIDPKLKDYGTRLNPADKDMQEKIKAFVKDKAFQKKDGTPYLTKIGKMLGNYTGNWVGACIEQMKERGEWVE